MVIHVYIAAACEDECGMGRLGKISLSVGLGLIALSAIAIVAVWIRHTPTRNDAKLMAMNAEARRLMPLRTSLDWNGVPKNRWPGTIASLNPQWVQLYPWGVEVQIEGFFDGGWGYHILLNGRELPMPKECYEDLGRSIYWHGPC